MAEVTTGARAALSSAGVYSRLQRLLGAENVYRSLLSEHLRPAAGDRVLDIGCGPGDVLALLPDVHYVGFDLSPRYIAAARERWGSRGDFRCADVTRDDVLSAGERFDAILSVGVLHHLDDDGADRLMGTAAAALAPGGRLVTLDPAFAPGQARAARWLISRDRGQAVRDPAGYEALAAPHFAEVTSRVRHDLARVPYTHAVLECRSPAQVEARMIRRSPRRREFRK